jgi:hypothetical protein
MAGETLLSLFPKSRPTVNWPAETAGRPGRNDTET